MGEKEKGLAMQFEFALFASKSSSEDAIQAEWYTVKVPNPECRSSSSSPDVTLIEKPLVPFSRVRLAWLYREHAVIGSRLYSLGGMMTDSESLADVPVLELHRYYKVYSFDRSTPDDGWKAVAPMTFPNRTQPPCLVLDNKLFVLGALGSDLSEVEAKGYGWMEVYDPDLNTWEPLPNPPLGFPLSVCLPFYYATLVSKKQILVALESDRGRRFATFYVYHVNDRCWTCLEPPQRALRYYYPKPIFGRRGVIVDDTVYWGFVLDGIVRVQSHNIDTDKYFHGCLDTQLFFKDDEFEVPDLVPRLPFLHLADQIFCLFVFSFVNQMVGKVFLNVIVLNISLNPNPFKEGEQELRERYKYHFMGDSSKQLNISLVSVQKYPFVDDEFVDDDDDGFTLHDVLLLDCRTNERRNQSYHLKQD